MGALASGRCRTGGTAPGRGPRLRSRLIAPSGSRAPPRARNPRAARSPRAHRAPVPPARRRARYGWLTQGFQLVEEVRVGDGDALGTFDLRGASGNEAGHSQRHCDAMIAPRLDTRAFEAARS